MNIHNRNLFYIDVNHAPDYRTDIRIQKIGRDLLQAILQKVLWNSSCVKLFPTNIGLKLVEMKCHWTKRCYYHYYPFTFKVRSSEDICPVATSSYLTITIKAKLMALSEDIANYTSSKISCSRASPRSLRFSMRTLTNLIDFLDSYDPRDCEFKGFVRWRGFWLLP